MVELKATIVNINEKMVNLIQTEIDALKTLQEKLDDFDLEGKIKDLEKQLDAAKFNNFIEKSYLKLHHFQMNYPY